MKKMLFPLIYFLLVALMLPAVSFAYIDPSVTSYAITAISGVVVAVGAFVVLYWRKARKKVRDKLGIDEKAGETEAAAVVYTDDAQPDGEQNKNNTGN